MSDPQSFDPVKILPDEDSLVRYTIERIARIASATLEVNETFSIVLSGGSTPVPVYEGLARDPFAGMLDWERVHVFFGDERCVPPDHEDSNYRMAYETLLKHVSIPESNIYRMRGEDDPEQAAKAYEAALYEFFGDDETWFDVNLLGMGEDGHTASLFPGTDAIHEDERMVIAHYVEKVDRWRISLTPPGILRSGNLMFLIAGRDKADALREVMEGDYQPDVYPSQVIARSDHAHLVWLLDAAVASKLS